MKEPDIIIDYLGGNCPVQAEGTINGRRFYFRARWEHWSLEIAPEGVTGSYGEWPDAAAAWSHEEPWGKGPFYAGWMSKEDARKMIAKGARLFVKRKG
jgi:hypothetical protein